MSDAVIEEDTLSPEDLAMAKEMISSEPEPTPEENSAEPEVVQEDETSDTPFVFKVKGEDREFTRDQIKYIVSREETFQKKFTKLESSDEYKLGVLMAAAKQGDKGAQKRLRSELLEMVTDGDIDSLEDVMDEYDGDKNLDKRKAEAELEEVFSEVKSDIDYEETLAKIDTDLKPRMPEKVFKKYNDTPAERRVMYDLIKSGRTDEVFDALDGEFQKLPLAERVRIKNDPDMYGSLVFEVIQDLNAQRQQKGAKVDQGNSDLDSVSTGNGSHRVEKESPAPDFANMSKEDFLEYERKFLGRNI